MKATETLKDSFARALGDLRISVTDKCNFRCGYCMPEEIYGFKYEFLPKTRILTFEEMMRLAKLFVKLGVKKIRITGGEPLLRQELDTLVEQLVHLPGVEDVALTTNGYLLSEHADRLRAAGLKRLTVSLDTLKPDKFRKLAGKHGDLNKVLDGIQAARTVGFDPIKINSVIQRNVNDDELLALAEFSRESGTILRLIEFMDVGNLNGWRLEKVVAAEEILKTISAKFPLRPLRKHYRSEVANRFEYLDGQGELGVIASVTQPFCGDCSRARLSADGKIYTCLFGTVGVDIKTPLRRGATDEDLLEIIRAQWRQRKDRYSEERTSSTVKGQEKRVEMYQIGG